MGTEVALSFTALRAQLENEKSSLFKIDENIKKIVQTGSGRFQNDRFNPTGEYTRGGNRIGGRNSFPDGGNNYSKNDEHFGKRKQETKTVFSRLSARVHDSDGEEEMSMSGPAPVVKRVKMPSAVSRELPTRAAVLRAQGGDEQARTRNRRMFGSLLGTLQKFKQEEIVLQTKEEKKAQVERKIEEAARQEREREQKERKTLFAERDHKKATIKALEAKMARVAEFERWEESQKHLGNFILTKAKPHVYWLPKKMSEAAEEKLTSSRKYHEKYMSKKREELQDELQRIENRVLRPRGPGAKENKPAEYSENHDDSLNDSQDGKQDGGKKRDKFAMDVDKDDSDDDRHDEVEVKVEDKEAADVTKEVAVDATKEVEGNNEVNEGNDIKPAVLEDSEMETVTEPSEPTAMEDAAPKPNPAIEEAAPKSNPAIEDAAPKPNPAIEDAAPKPNPAIEEAAPKSNPAIEEAVPKPNPSLAEEPLALPETEQNGEHAEQETKNINELEPVLKTESPNHSSNDVAPMSV